MTARGCTVCGQPGPAWEDADCCPACWQLNVAGTPSPPLELEAAREARAVRLYARHLARTQAQEETL